MVQTKSPKVFQSVKKVESKIKDLIDFDKKNAKHLNFHK